MVTPSQRTSAHLDEHGHDAGVLADRAMAFGAHPAVGQDLGDRVLGGRALFQLVGAAQGRDVVERMIITNVLQRIRNALDQVVLLDVGHDAVYVLYWEEGRGRPAAWPVGRAKSCNCTTSSPAGWCKHRGEIAEWNSGACLAASLGDANA
jgi:hypothetical protein